MAEALPALPDLRIAARDAAQRFAIPRNIFDALIERESAFDPNARGRAGEIGLGQLMPGTAAQLGVNPYDPLDNLTGAAKYLRQQYDRFGTWRDALAAYNGGPGGYLNSQAQAYARGVLDAAGIPADASPGLAGTPGANPRLEASLPAREEKERTARELSFMKPSTIWPYLRARGFDILFGGAGLLLILLGLWALMNTWQRGSGDRIVRAGVQGWKRGRARSSSAAGAASAAADRAAEVAQLEKFLSTPRKAADSLPARARLNELKGATK